MLSESKEERKITNMFEENLNLVKPTVVFKQKKQNTTIFFVSL